MVPVESGLDAPPQSVHWALNPHLPAMHSVVASTKSRARIKGTPCCYKPPNMKVRISQQVAGRDLLAS
jgi:hypothetical protein